jgi:hypothetical protein
MENNNEEKAAGTILTSDERVCGESVPGVGDSSVQVDETLGAYEGEESVSPGPGEIISRGDLIRMKAQIESALTLVAPTDLREIGEIVASIAVCFNFPSMRKRGIRETIFGRGSLPEDPRDVIRYLSPDNEKYAVAVTTCYVRIYCKQPHFNWVKTYFFEV